MAARPLNLVLGEDNQIWASDPSTGIGYRMPPSDQKNQHPPVAGAGSGAPAGIPEAPTDGSLYGRENAAWAKVPAPPPAGLPLTGGTLTGQLIVKGDQFDQNITGPPTPAFLVENSAGTDAIGICIGQFGDSINFVKANGGQANIRLQTGAVVLAYPTGLLTLGASTFIFDCNDTGGFHLGANCDSATGDFMLTGKTGFGIQIKDSQNTANTRLHMATDGSGDIIATCTLGTNAGKSVNLTTGKWV